ncbi:MAG TPA: HNH endonuclease [Polyangia bacterium]|jgi:5-methylcytosine-specific restriction endonuclease McrA|nr:HNH endonuclease [Polyangia bacterium]
MRAASPGGQRGRVLGIIATDNTFHKSDHRGAEVWVGKCIHCNTHLVVGLDGVPISQATIEHIVPRTRGGTNDLENLALACARCNREKGIRHDPRRSDAARAQEVITRLQERRRQRWRDPLR